MKVLDVMTASPECVPPEGTVKKAAETMRELNVGALPICENDKLVGMITDRDITIRAVAEGKDPNKCTVREFMTSNTRYCFEDDDISTAARIMEEEQIRRLAVLNRNKRIVGIVSLGDLDTRSRDDTRSGEVLHRVSEPSQPSL